MKTLTQKPGPLRGKVGLGKTETAFRCIVEARREGRSVETNVEYNPGYFWDRIDECYRRADTGVRIEGNPPKHS